MPAPSLVATISLDTTSVAPGTTASIEYFVQNFDSEASTATTERFYLTTDGSIKAGQAPFATATIPVLTSGGGFSGTISYVIPDNTPPGNYEVTSMIDEGGDIHSAAFSVPWPFDLKFYDFPDGANNGGAIVLAGDGTQIQVLSGSAKQGGVISETSGSFGFEKIGDGTLILTSNETYTGVTTITAGTLQIGNDNAPGPTTTGAITGNIVDNAALMFDRESELTYGGVISGTGSVSIEWESSKVVFTGENSYSGGTTLINTGSTAQGILQIGDGGTTGSIVGDVVDDGYLSFDRSDSVVFSGNITGAGTLANMGSSLLILTGSNTVNQAFSSGTIQIGNGGTEGSFSGNIEGNVIFDRSDAYAYAGSIGGGTVEIKSGTVTLGYSLDSDVKVDTGAAFVAGTTVFFPLTVSLVSDSTFRFASSRSFGEGITLLGTGATIDTGGYVVTFGGSAPQGIISGTGDLNVGGGGTLILTAANTYTGTTAVAAGTTLEIDKSNQLGSSSVLTLGDANGAGTLFAQNYYNGVTLNALRSIVLETGGGIIETDVGTLVMNSAISGGGALTKVGAGTLILNGNSIFTGATHVTAGSLLLDGSMASEITVDNSATFGGSGTVGSLDVSGALAPGSISRGNQQPGTLAVAGTLTFETTATYTADVWQYGADDVAATGAVDLSGDLVLNLEVYRPGTTFTILQSDTALTGSFATVTINESIRGMKAVVSYDATHVYVTVSKVPDYDFNGDGESDILWQSNDGSALIWQLDGATKAAVGTPGNPGASWSAIGAGDFNGDGKSDILWQNSNGSVAIWTMNGATLTGGGVLANPGPGWTALGAGDFDGDGKADILWQANDGTVAVWTMNGTAVTGGGIVANPGAGWRYAGTGDFDDDGKADILWQNANGQVAVWLMNGTTVMGGGVVNGNPGSSWHVRGAGDFDGDGKSDILWQNDDGTVAIWTMDGATVTGGGIVGNPGAGWTALAARDTNGDGQADILWQNSDGATAVWLMDGTAVTGGGIVGSAPGTSWHIITG